MLNYMVEECLLGKGVGIREGSLERVERRGEAHLEKRQEGVNMAGPVGCLPAANPLFLIPVARCPATGMIQTIHGNAFLLASE